MLNSDSVIESHKNLLGTFNKYAFQDFFLKVLGEEYPSYPFDVSQVKHPYFPVHVQTTEQKSFEFYESWWMILFYPQKLLKSKKHKENIIFPNGIADTLKRINESYPFELFMGKTQNIYRGIVDFGKLYVITNLTNVDTNEYAHHLGSMADKIISRTQKNTGFGTIDYYFRDYEASKTICKHLKKFVTDSFDGVTLNITKDRVKVLPFQNQSPSCSGLIKSHFTPIETVITTGIVNDYYILKEFEKVINDGTEADIEEFMRVNYQLIFGKHYDKIETQLWLKFPEIDIGNRNRRFDIFARNSLKGDWDLFEIKKNMPIIKFERGVPNFTSHVYSAIRQGQNYMRSLRQNDVKSHFAKIGIEYFEPSLNIVIGRKSQITHQQWRILQKDSSNDLNIIPYDELLENVKQEIRNRQIYLH